jgi:3-hydroxybutyryl-CoA dehydrogenase
VSDVRQVTVIGAGTMGHGIAQVSAMAGYDVVLNDMSEALVRAGLERIEANLDKGVARGKVSDDERAQTRSRIRSEVALAHAVRGADLVIEAVPERMELKRQLFDKIADELRPTAVLATNTSSLSIDDLSAAAPSPSRFLGLHFFNPVHIMGLVEVVHGSSTSSETLDEAVAYVKRLGKEPIVVKDSPGFASSRLGVALGLEAMRMLEEGVASAVDIDKAMELGYRHPMGPLRLTDLVGLDVRLGIAEYLDATLGGSRFEPPEILRRLVKEGKLGKKSGEGFYRWDAGEST